MTTTTTPQTGSFRSPLIELRGTENYRLWRAQTDRRLQLLDLEFELRRSLGVCLVDLDTWPVPYDPPCDGVSMHTPLAKKEALGFEMVRDSIKKVMPLADLVADGRKLNTKDLLDAVVRHFWSLSPQESLGFIGDFIKLDVAAFPCFVTFLERMEFMDARLRDSGTEISSDTVVFLLLRNVRQRNMDVANELHEKYHSKQDVKTHQDVFRLLGRMMLDGRAQLDPTPANDESSARVSHILLPSYDSVTEVKIADSSATQPRPMISSSLCGLYHSDGLPLHARCGLHHGGGDEECSRRETLCRINDLELRKKGNLEA